MSSLEVRWQMRCGGLCDPTTNPHEWLLLCIPDNALGAVGHARTRSIVQLISDVDKPNVTGTALSLNHCVDFFHGSDVQLPGLFQSHLALKLADCSCGVWSHEAIYHARVQA